MRLPSPLAMLVAALAAAAPLAAAATRCDAPARTWLERPLPADCLDCWQSSQALPPATLALDWVLPTTDDAPMAVAALPEGAERLGPAPGRIRRQALPPVPAGWRLSVDSGLAWHGYVALTFDLAVPRGGARPPEGANGWVALVERIPAGSDGSGSDRRLVRALAGPLTLQPESGQRRLQHVVAVRLPANAQAERLGAVGWIEQPDGRVWLARESARPGCATDPAMTRR